jgi:quercetin dioxygenase-like cupin family protein
MMALGPLVVSTLFEENKGRFDVDLGIAHHFSGGVYAKQMHLPKGYKALSHPHKYDHMSILAKGVVCVETDYTKTNYHAPAVIDVKAGTNHAITALEDVTWFCIHATEETDADAIDNVLIKEA